MDSTPKHRRGQAAPAGLRAPPADERQALADEREMHLDELAQQVGVQAVSQVGQSDRVARGEEAFPATLRVTMTLMMAIARTERDIAETLQGMAAHSAGERAARRRKLAADAVEGAHEADKRREQLQQLAEQWSEHASVVTLHQLLAHAASVLTELARTEQDIADTFTSLARHDGSHLAAQRRQLAKAAAADAQYARNRARDLHQLARTSAASTRPF